MTTINAFTLHQELVAAADSLASQPSNDLPQFRTFRTGEKSTMRVLNSVKRLNEVAAIVKSKAALFGGGFPKAQRKAKPKAWPAPALRAAEAAIKEGDYAGALSLSESELGGFFVVQPLTKHNKDKPRALLIVAPLAVDGLPDNFVSAKGLKSGIFQVFDLASGLTISEGIFKTRAKAEEVAVERWKSAGEQKTAHALAKAAKLDQVDARNLWLTERGLPVTTVALAPKLPGLVQESPIEPKTLVWIQKSPIEPENLVWIQKSIGYAPLSTKDKPFYLVSRAENYGIATPYRAKPKFSDIIRYFDSEASAHKWANENGYVFGPCPYSRGSFNL